MSLSSFLPSTTREEKVFSIKFSKMKNESQLNLSAVHRIFQVLSPHTCICADMGEGDIHVYMPT